MAQHESHAPSIRHTIAVSSGKGGVGKSTTTVHLGLALQKAGYRVGILDADIHGPNLPTMLGIVDSPRLIQKEGKEFFVPPIGHGIKVMSMGFLIEADQPVIWRGPMLHNLLTQFSNQVEWGDLDFLLVDMPPGTGDVQISLSQLFKLRASILVTTPQEIALQDVRKAFRMWEQVKVPTLGVIENMSYFQNPVSGEKHFIFGQGGAERMAEKYGVRVLGQVPLVEALRAGVDAGSPLTVSDPNHTLSALYDGLATQVAQLAGQMEKEVDPSRILQIGKF